MDEELERLRGMVSSRDDVARAHDEEKQKMNALFQDQLSKLCEALAQQRAQNDELRAQVRRRWWRVRVTCVAMESPL
jgi:hypothetical protein